MYNPVTKTRYSFLQNVSDSGPLAIGRRLDRVQPRRRGQRVRQTVRVSISAQIENFPEKAKCSSPVAD